MTDHELPAVKPGSGDENGPHGNELRHVGPLEGKRAQRPENRQQQHRKSQFFHEFSPHRAVFSSQSMPRARKTHTFFPSARKKRNFLQSSELSLYFDSFPQLRHNILWNITINYILSPVIYSVFCGFCRKKTSIFKDFSGISQNFHLHNSNYYVTMVTK